MTIKEYEQQLEEIKNSQFLDIQTKMYLANQLTAKMLEQILGEDEHGSEGSN